jgi:hypothetical protein
MEAMETQHGPSLALEGFEGPDDVEGSEAGLGEGDGTVSEAKGHLPGSAKGLVSGRAGQGPSTAVRRARRA